MMIMISYGTNFGKTLLNTKCVLYVLSKLIILKFIRRDTIIIKRTPNTCQNVEINICAENILKKYSNIRFHENLLSWCRVLPFRRTE